MYIRLCFVFLRKSFFFTQDFFCRNFFQFLITFFTSLVEKLKKINFFFFTKTLKRFAKNHFLFLLSSVICSKLLLFSQTPSSLCFPLHWFCSQWQKRSSYCSNLWNSSSENRALLYLFSFCSWSVLPFVCSLFSFGLCIYVQSMGVEDVYLAVEAMKTAAKRAMWPVASYSVSFLLRLETLGNPIWSGKEVLEEFSRAV